MTSNHHRSIIDKIGLFWITMNWPQNQVGLRRPLGFDFLPTFTCFRPKSLNLGTALIIVQQSKINIWDDLKLN